MDSTSKGGRCRRRDEKDLLINKKSSMVVSGTDHDVSMCVSPSTTSVEQLIACTYRSCRVFDVYVPRRRRRMSDLPRLPTG